MSPPEPATTPLLDRDAELSVIRTNLEAAVRGVGTLTVLEADAGMGKSRLVDAAASAARARGVRVLRARGDTLTRDVPYGCIRELLGSLRLSDPGEFADLGAGTARPAAELIRGDEVDPASRTGLDLAIYWLLRNVAERGPLLVTLEKAHWADRLSLRAMAVIATRVEDVPAALLLSTRPNEREAQQDLLDRIAAEPHATVLALRPLGEDAAVRLVRDRLPAASDGFCRACASASGGNPFVLEQLTTEVRNAGIVPDDDAAGRITSLGARGVARALRRRLDGLPASATALARAIAVLGDGTTLRRAAALAGISAAEAASAADGLTRVGLLASVAPPAFSHAIARAAIHESIPDGERSEAHRVAARLLAGEDAGDDSVAAHLLAAAPMGDAWVVERLRGAAAAAARQGAPDAAIVYLRRALGEAADPALVGVLNLELGIRGIDCQDPGAVEALHVACRRLDDEAQRLDATWHLTQALIQARRTGEALSVADASVAATAGSPTARSLQLELAAMDALRQLDGQHAELRRRLADFSQRAHLFAGFHSRVCAHRAWELACEGVDRSRCLAFADEALMDPALVDLEVGAGPAWFMAIRALMVSDRLEDCLDFLRARLELARRSGHTFPLGLAAWYSSDTAFRMGDICRAEQDARMACALIDKGHAVRGSCVEALVNALVVRGELGEAATLVDEHGTPEATSELGLLLARGRLRAAQGDLDGGLADVLAVGDGRERQLRHNPAWNPWRSEAAVLHLLRGARADAERLAAEELELALRWGAARAIGIALRALGLARDDRSLLEQAVATLEGAGAVYELARARVELGAWLRRSGERSQAREFLTAGLDAAHRIGAEPLLRRAGDELAASGARPRRYALTGVEALTPSERRACELAIQGMTNRQIAQTLFVSLKTVETHLRNAYGKLGIGSRSELTAAFRAEGAA